MKELINNELLELQQELENLKSASEMIASAGKASDSVIREAETIHKEFSQSLTKLTSLYQEYVDKLNSVSQDKQKELLSNLQDFLQKQSDNLLNAKTEHESTLKKISESESAAVDKVAKESLEKIEMVKTAYLNQNSKTDQLLNSYLELAQSTTELKDKISSVDFPNRFLALEKLISEAASEQKKSNEEFEKINKIISDNQAYKQSQKNTAELSSLKGLIWFAIILLILILGVAGFAAFKLMH
ncbi:MAG: hypothetical protein IJ150_12105 [Bacteroidales bacterium]|nr:hypothetical protein [Bacteroidales bacterium]